MAASMQAARVLTTSKDATAKIFDIQTGSSHGSFSRDVRIARWSVAGMCERTFNESFEEMGYNSIIAADVCDARRGKKAGFPDVVNVPGL